MHRATGATEGHGARPLAIAALNLAYDPSCATTDALLDRYHTLTGWSQALAKGGAAVTIVQRFSVDERRVDRGVAAVFVKDSHSALLAARAVSEPVVAAVKAVQPDVVHVNGLMFPAMLQALARALPNTVLVVQDHSGMVAKHPPWPLRSRRIAEWRAAFMLVDGFTFTAAALAARWHPVGLPSDACIFEIPEASTVVVPVDRMQARAAIGAADDLVVAWVGRLDANKDPLTVLDGLEQALPHMLAARCWMVYGEPSDLEAAVRRRVRQSPALDRIVTLVGAVPHARVTDYLSAADIFVSGSHHEGSGYALIEALACGVTPCVTDIPAHRALIGDCGAHWRPGHAAECAGALTSLAARHRSIDAARVRQRFDDVLTWDAIARTTIAHYTALVAERRERLS